MNEKLLKNINTYKDQNIHFQAQKNLLINIKKFPNIEMIKYDNIFNDKNAQDDQNTYIFTKKCKKKYKEKLLKYKNFWTQKCSKRLKHKFPSTKIYIRNSK